jgi:hypothetical protein
MVGGARSAPVSGGYGLKKTGARSARARTRGQNPLVYHIFMRREGGIEEGGIKEGEIGKRQIVEGGYEETFHCFSQT